MDDLKTLREEFRAGTPTPSADDLRGLRERLVTETRRTPGRFAWLRGFRLSSPRLMIPALAGALTLALVLGVVIIQGQRDEFTMPGPDQWWYEDTLVIQTGSDDPERVRLESWTSADGLTWVSRVDGGALKEDTMDGPIVAGGYFDDREQLTDFYRTVLDDPIPALDRLVDRSQDATTCERYDEQNEAEGGSPARDCEEYLADPVVRNGLRVSVAYSLLDAGTPPEVQTALYGALRELPTVREDGVVRDEVDRDSLAISVVEPDFVPLESQDSSRLHLLFDPDTHLYAGVRWENAQGQVTSSNLVLSTGIVEKPGEVPWARVNR